VSPEETDRLCRVAHETDDLRDGVTVDLVGFDLIMTNPTWVDFLAARRLQLSENHLNSQNTL